MAHSDRAMSDALKDYVNSTRLTKDIASDYGVSASTLTVWATKAGVKLRGRGRERQRTPDARTREILELAKIKVLEDVGLHFKMTKQRVSKIVKRWAGWEAPRQSPFVTGEIVVWKKREFTVVEGGPIFGKVRDSAGRIIHNFYWTMDNEQAVRKSEIRPNGHVRKITRLAKAKARAKAKVKAAAKKKRKRAKCR